MRIAIVNQHLEDATGGSELQCDLVARGLVGRGHDVVYLVVDVGASSSRDSIARTRSMPYRTRRVARTEEAITAACIAEDPHVVYWRFNRPMLSPVAAQLADSQIPLVFAVAHVDDVSRWPVRPWPSASLRPRAAELWTRLSERRTWGAFRSVAAVASQREDFVGLVPVEDQRVIRNLMSAEFARFDHPRPYVAWVGSLQGRKRPEVLPDIAAKIAPLGFDVLVAGQIREPRFASMFNDNIDNLHHVGLLPLATTVGMIAGARLLVITAEEEGFANVLIQAWWHGTPTVSLQHDPDRLIVTHDLGVSCAGDIDMMMRAIVELASEDSVALETRRRRIGLFAQDFFATDRTLDALESLLHDLVARK